MEETEVRKAHVLVCTFCKRTEHEVATLVAGPGVYICGTCVDVAHRIVHASTAAPPPAP